jgi:hypothetical protein
MEHEQQPAAAPIHESPQLARRIGQLEENGGVERPIPHSRSSTWSPHGVRAGSPLEALSSAPRALGLGVPQRILVAGISSSARSTSRFGASFARSRDVSELIGRIARGWGA